MRQIHLILLIILTLNSCVKNKLEPKELYNLKANEIIFETLKENNCNCLLEIPKQSLIEMSSYENPSYDIRNFLKNELKSKNNIDLDTLVSLSKNFTLNIDALEKNNVKIINLKDIPKFGDTIGNGNVEKNLKMCPKGIINFNKPVFDKTYQKAVLDYSFAFSCTKTYPLPIYQFKNGKWNRIKKIKK
ncbi:hypothetical protein IRZ71_05780 [Flavobacterium sp. ANB]|uniref:hypothetical protein n=1 Tax=unclassified Flavobacterium TaxID=196869 RepID=UPI0012B8106B|nr:MULTISPECIES: hypothetical protein [unclassified Flavobacterium]MBF4515840.1 hypothetical protein [Flavobacterium sp. ANB]MTD68842.1 hypothetical protein [Flavobacterium sp. LC2016-13]